MDYTIKNIPSTLNKELLTKAKELAENDDQTEGGSITPNEVTELLKEASKDGDISLEEVRFIAGLTTEQNVKNLAKSHFNPVNGEIQFENVSSPRFKFIRVMGELLERQLHEDFKQVFYRQLPVVKKDFHQARFSKW